MHVAYSDAIGDGDIVCGVALAWILVKPRTLANVAFLHIDIAFVSCADAIMIPLVGEETIEHVNLSESHPRTPFHATLIPPTVGKCDIQVPWVFRAGIAAADEIGETMVVRTARTSSLGVYQITKPAPCYGDIVGTIVDVEVSIYAILEIAMVHPDIMSVLNEEIVVAIYVVSTRSLERHVSKDDVLAVVGKLQDSRVLFCLIHVDKRGSWQSDDGFVADAIVSDEPSKLDFTFHVDNAFYFRVFFPVYTKHGIIKLLEVGYNHFFAAHATSDVSIYRCPSNGFA